MTFAHSPSLLCSDFASPQLPIQASPKSYSAYSPAFSEETAYQGSTFEGTSSALTAGRSRQVEGFGNKFLSAISENAAATACNLSRRSSLQATAKGLGFGGIFRKDSSRRASSITTLEEAEEESEFIMEYKSSLTGGPDRRPSTSTPKDTTAPASFRRFSWFSSNSSSTPKPTPASPSLDPSETPLHQDLLQPPTSLLFPHGTPSASSPNAYTDLLRAAEAAITRLQTAHKSHLSALHAARADRDALAEEAAEASTRAQHLKLQLEEMAARAVEQDVAMRVLAEELAMEKHRSRQREMARESGGSSVASDSGFDENEDAETASSCSRPLTPVETSPVLGSQHAWDGKGSGLRPLELRGGLGGSRTCEVDAGVWNWMREEKSRLERRVRELEGVVEGCLDLVGGGGA